MSFYDVCKESADYIKQRFDATDAVGIILGSGLGNLAHDIVDPQILTYKEIPNWPETNVPGHEGKLILGQLNGAKVLCMAGRFHFYEGYDMKTVSMAVRVFKLLGVKAMIITNAAGGCNTTFEPGTLMVIDDFINYMGDNPLVGKPETDFGPRFPDMVNALPKYLKDIAFEAAKEINLNLRKGVYMAFRGPNFETPAEVRMAQILGADCCGMSTVPEIIAARHCSMPVLGISCITNMAAGITGEELTHEEVQETASRVNQQFKDLVKGIVVRIK